MHVCGERAENGGATFLPWSSNMMAQEIPSWFGLSWVFFSSGNMENWVGWVFFSVWKLYLGLAFIAITWTFGGLLRKMGTPHSPLLTGYFKIFCVFTLGFILSLGWCLVSVQNVDNDKEMQVNSNLGPSDRFHVNCMEFSGVPLADEK